MQVHHQNYKKHLRQAFVADCVAVFSAALILALFSWTLTLSFLMGALVLLLANTVFFYRLFFSAHTQTHYAPFSIIKRFYLGALFKWLVLFTGCYLVFKFGFEKFNLSIWPFLLSFILITTVFYLSLLTQAFSKGRAHLV